MWQQAGLFVFFGVGAFAQTPTFSTDVKVVTLFASVRDRDGRIIKDLDKDDFELREDGRKQTIRYFSRESDLPLIIGLLIDTSRSMRTVFEPERVASTRFLDQVLREQDRAFVAHFDVRVGVLQDLTSSREQLADALGELKIPPRPATKLYDAIVRESEEIMRAQSGRKAFVLLSDGMDVRSRSNIGTAIEYAQRADTMIYTVLFNHPTLPARKDLGPRAMARLARETGGGFFTVSDDLPIEKIYALIEDELRHQYSIGYSSDRPDSDGKYRKIELTAKRKGFSVRTRDGYYPK